MTPDSPSEDATHGNRMLSDAWRLWSELAGLAHDRLLLAVLETRRAGNSLVTMIAAGVMVAVLLVSAWLGLVAAAIFTLVATGLSVAAALTFGVLANVVIALLLVRFIRWHSVHLQWPATLRSLQRPAPSAHEACDDDASRA